MTGPVDPIRAREDRAARDAALAALRALRDDLEVRIIAARPRSGTALGRLDGLKEARGCVDQAIARRGGAS